MLQHLFVGLQGSIFLTGLLTQHTEIGPGGAVVGVFLEPLL